MLNENATLSLTVDATTWCAVLMGYPIVTELKISIYPNPVTDIAVMKVNMVQAGNVQISLTNMLGQNVMNLDKGFVAAENQQFMIDVSRLNAGIYFATLQVNGERYTQKLVVE